MTGRGLRALLSLDGLDLRESGAILVAPFDIGRLRLPLIKGRSVVQFGEFRGGEWTVLEGMPPQRGPVSVTIDADRATCMILICESGSESRWSAKLTESMIHPERIEGY